MSKDAFQKLVKVAIQKAAFAYLHSEKQKRDKVKNVEHRYLKLQPYLCPREFVIKEAKLLFQLRTKMVDVRENFKNKYSDTMCPVCMGTCTDSQEHVLDCPVLLLNCNIVAKHKVEYCWIYSMDVGKQAEVTRIFKIYWDLRKKLLDKDED